MFGGLGGILITKSAGWLFDTYRQAGIAKAWIETQTSNLSHYAHQILSMNLVNKHGTVIDLYKTELGNLPENVVKQLTAIDPVSFLKLKELQTPFVQSEMTTAYAIVFAFCALAYIIAWSIMKVLVPKFKPITL